jgi:hypothetical protein
MAMPMPTSVDPKPEPVSRTRARPTPDEEAMLLMAKVVERAQVATSFAKIAAGLLTVTAARASVRLAPDLRSRYERMRKMARIAAEAAVHVATQRPAPQSSNDNEIAPDSQAAPITQDAPRSR